MKLRDAFVSAPFIVLALTFFACCAAHAGPIFHTVTYAMTCGLAPLAAVTVYSVEGLAGLGGRLALGVLADRLGVKRVLIAGLLIQAVAAGMFVFAARLGEFYAVAAVFGFAYGGVMPLYAVLAREYFGQRILGAVFGAAAMVSSLGMALGPALGGWIYDTLRPLHVDVRRLGRDRPRRRRDRASPFRRFPAGQSTQAQGGRNMKIPQGMHSVTPHLICAGAAKAIDFYKKAFGAEETRAPARARTAA